MNAVGKRRDVLIWSVGALAFAWWISGRNQDSATSLNVPEVDLAQAQALIEAGAIVLDVRGKEAFDHRHLPPAVLMPLAVLQAAIPASLADAKERQIVVYCNDGVSTGPKAASILLQNGYKNVVNMKPGIEGWDKAGLPLVKAT